MREGVLDIPLFPLNTVLFPGITLPLQVFEESYQLLVNECLQGDRHFGVVLTKPVSTSEGTAATAYTVGTSALLTGADALDGGGMDVQAAGLERFRVLHFLRTEPYPVGRVEAFPLEGVDSPQINGQVRAASGLFARYLRLVSEVLGTVVDIESTPRDSSSLAYLIAIALQVSLEEKQELLSVSALPRLLSRELMILGREETLLTRMRVRQDSNAGYVRGATGYLSLS